MASFYPRVYLYVKYSVYWYQEWGRWPASWHQRGAVTTRTSSGTPMVWATAS